MGSFASVNFELDVAIAFGWGVMVSSKGQLV